MSSEFKEVVDKIAAKAQYQIIGLLACFLDEYQKRPIPLGFIIRIREMLSLFYGPEAVMRFNKTYIKVKDQNFFTFNKEGFLKFVFGYDVSKD